MAGFLGLVGPGSPPQIYPGILATVDLFPLAAIEMVETDGHTFLVNGSINVLTVPSLEIWHLVHLNFVKSAGTYEIDELSLFSLQSSYSTTLAQGVGVSTNIRYVHGPVDHWMYPGDAVRIAVINWSVAGSMTVEARVQKWDYDPAGLD